LKPVLMTRDPATRTLELTMCQCRRFMCCAIVPVLVLAFDVQSPVCAWQMKKLVSAREIKYCTIPLIHYTPNVRPGGEAHGKLTSFSQQPPQQLKKSFIETSTNEQMEGKLATRGQTELHTSKTR